MSIHTATLTHSRVAKSTRNRFSRFSPFAIWLALIAYVALAKILLDAFFPDAFAAPDQAAIFSWLPIGAIAGTGLVGVWLSRRTGFSPAWTARAGVARQLLLPTLVGVALGAVQIAIDLATGASAVLNAAHGVEQQFTDFPSMLLIFTAAPILVESVYRLLLIPLPLWLISTVLLRGRAQTPLFWLLAVLASLVEPLTQTGPSMHDLGTATAAVLIVQGFAFNLVQAAFFRRYGFVASIAVREGHYLLWHVLYIH